MSLPEPSPEAREHSDRVAEHIRGEIAASGGWISFARYMELALYAPGLGYRSEEHTSELQSRSDLVCRLLLEKKKKNNNTNTRCDTIVVKQLSVHDYTRNRASS